jgi:hypothetical protein
MFRLSVDAGPLSATVNFTDRRCMLISVCTSSVPPRGSIA